MDQGTWAEVAAIFVHNNPDAFEVDLLNINQAVEFAKALEALGYIVQRKPYSTRIQAAKEPPGADSSSNHAAK